MCLDIFESGHAEVASIVEGGDIDEINKVASTFNICGGATTLLKDRKNIDFFVGYSLVPITVQSNDPTCDEPLCNIQKVSIRERKTYSIGCIVETPIHRSRPFFVPFVRYVMQLWMSTNLTQISHRWRF